MLRVNVAGLEKADTGLRQFVATVTDLTPFWSELGKTLSETTQNRWPLRRRSGRLRTSLTWRGDGLGRGGVYEPTANRLKFGTNLFYSRFAQYGTKRQRTTPLILVNEADARARLVAWMTARAADAGLEVDR